ncbi:MAG: cytochrome b/b6 domain-containing protein [Hyphomonadaceae bacterium]
MSDAAQSRYTSVAIALHWVIAVGIVGQILFGWWMGDLEDRALRFSMIQLHKSFGITVLVLSVARIVWRLMNPQPPEPPMPAWQSLAAKAVHVGFYVLMILMPLTGWIMVSASPSGIGTHLFNAVPWAHIPGLPEMSQEAKRAFHEPIENVHSKLAWVAIGLLALHVGAALKHQFIDRDQLMARMAPGVFGKTSGPVSPARGLVPALGAAAILLLAGIAGGFVSPAPSPQEPGQPAAQEQQSAETTPSGAPYWAVNSAQSSIRFKAVYMGRPFEGTFDSWTSEIQFDPAEPAAARIHTTIKMDSGNTGEPYFDGNMTEGDWFDVRQFPDATFSVNEGVAHLQGNEYEATGILTIKGVDHPVRLPFTLDIDGDTATVHGETTLKRMALGVGAETKTEGEGDDEWVGDDVGIVIDLTAVRQ